MRRIVCYAAALILGVNFVAYAQATPGTQWVASIVGGALLGIFGAEALK